MKSIYNIIEKDIIFFDLETTGLDIKQDRIVEISAIKYRKDKTKVSIQKRFNPNRPVHPKAQEIHGLSNDDLKDYPTFEESATELLEFFKGCDLGGYNCLNFDIPLLFEEFSRSNMLLDTFNINIIDSYNLLNKFETRKLNDVYKRFFGKDIENQHEAESDILATIDVFEKQVTEYKLEDKSIKEISDIIRSTADNEKILDLSGWFKKDKDGKYLYNKGKNKDKEVKDDIQYLRWFMENTSMENNSRAVANKLYEYYNKNKVNS